MDALLRALAKQELHATHQLAIQPLRRTRRSLRAAAADHSVDVDVRVDALQNAVILVEHEGELSWHFPDPAQATPQPARETSQRRLAGAKSSSGAGARLVTIPVRLRAVRTSDPSRKQRGRRSFSIGSVLSAAKAVVLKFVAGTAAGVALHLLERNVSEGLIVMQGDDPRTWSRVEKLADLSLPDEPLRIMLWIHGTFSSTVGGFGAITATEDGKALWARARKHYHVIIGFDHKTLSATPLENAIDLVERLGRFERPMQIDAVMHSRGGLVYRSLVELLLPISAKRPELGPAVFVAVPNRGTSIVEPDNWRTLVDLYSNLAAGAFAVLTAIGAVAPALVLGELVSGLGAFVKYLASVVITERKIPGLAAMEPDGPFIQQLNATNAGQPRPEACCYLAITSNFDSQAATTSGKPIGLPAALLRRLADGLADQLFREKNDLVVNEPSMKQIDVQAGSFIDAALDFGDSAVVYHTVYFAQQQVAQQLNMWLLDPKARAGLQARSGVLAMLPSIHRPFTRMRYHAAVRTQRAVPPQPRRMTRAARKRELRGATRESTAKLARAASSHLDALFGTRHATKPSALARPASATAARNYAPKLRQTTSERSRTRDKRDVHVVSYEQLHRSIPIFGTRVNVELDAAGQLIAAGAKLAQVSGVSRTPKLSERRAGAALAAELKLSSAEARALTKQKAALSFFYERTTKTWHLTYCFANVPARPPSNSQRSARSAARAKHKRDGHGIGPGPRQRFPRYDYLVDANAGALVYYYSRTPTAAKRAAPGKIPGRLRGIDDEGVMQTFFGLQTAAGFELRDPARCIRTHDLAGGDADTVPVPRRPISSLKPSFGQEAGAGVSAHVNSGHVFDFYNSVLFRNGIDDKGMEVVNVVNCTSPADEPPPQWDNACWYLNKMWYGQTIDRGKKRSYARYLDIIGHELTHGVTEKTCDLVYREESGALNESFSDIFGVIINNWIKARAADVRDWDWEIGPGLGETKNKPLRNMANPKLTGDPAHVREMSQLDPGEKPNDDNDLGYVHTNSNVHNKAAYNVLTASAAGAKGKRRALVFAPEDVARLYYYALQRIDRTADFEDVYFTLLQVVRTYYPDESEQTGKCAAITAAYAVVGIPRTR